MSVISVAKHRLCARFYCRAHFFKSKGDTISSPILQLRRGSDFDNKEYKCVYNECFFKMRTALKRFPVNCCPGREELKDRQNNIFILRENDMLIGSVSIYENEIDDLIVAKQFQLRRYGEALLRSAVSYLQKRGTESIFLHVADWNQRAIEMYKNNF